MTLIGWCARCGRECFDGQRHTCPIPMPGVNDHIALRKQVQRIIDHFDMRSEMYTNDADLALGMVTIARAAIGALPSPQSGTVE